MDLRSHEHMNVCMANRSADAGTLSNFKAYSLSNCKAYFSSNARLTSPNCIRYKSAACKCDTEPIRTCPSLAEYYQAKARTLDPEKQLLTCEDIFKKRQFCLPYDYLVIATGCKTNTFNTPGVAEREGQEARRQAQTAF
eukprot:516198-Pleurochrysis_carterae.AAC.2